MKAEEFQKILDENNGRWNNLGWKKHNNIPNCWESGKLSIRFHSNCVFNEKWSVYFLGEAMESLGLDPESAFDDMLTKIAELYEELEFILY